MGKERILLVENDTGTRDLIALYLKKRGYDVVTTKNGEEALAVIFNEMFQLIVLDIEMPGIDGFDVCKKIREHSNIPIIFISGRRDVMDKVKCFELGGDDYVTKPFNFAELEARIKANLRRLQIGKQKFTPDVITCGEITINLNTFECFIGGKKIELSVKELQLLELFIKHPNQIFSAEKLYEHIWEKDTSSNTRTVRTHIRNLRQKIEKDAGNPAYIKTVRGLGYRFVTDQLCSFR